MFVDSLKPNHKIRNGGESRDLDLEGQKNITEVECRHKLEEEKSK